jgi:hypothetical protein
MNACSRLSIAALLAVGASQTSAQSTNSVPVTVEKFPRAETDVYFRETHKGQRRSGKLFA